MQIENLNLNRPIMNDKSFDFTKEKEYLKNLFTYHKEVFAKKKPLFDKETTRLEAGEKVEFTDMNDKTRLYVKILSDDDNKKWTEYWYKDKNTGHTVYFEDHDSDGNIDEIGIHLTDKVSVKYKDTLDDGSFIGYKIMDLNSACKERHYFEFTKTK